MNQSTASRHRAEFPSARQLPCDTGFQPVRVTFDSERSLLRNFPHNARSGGLSGGPCHDEAFCARRKRPAFWLLLLLLSFCILHSSFSISSAAPPTTKPKESAVDSILGLSKKTDARPADPTTQPAAKTPNTPLKDEAADDQSRPGVITMSDGTKVKGKIATTQDKPIRIWVEKEKDYEDVPFDQIESAEVDVLWERDEKEWNFKETGSDIKVYSGKTYPARQTQYTFTLTDGTVIKGDVVAPLYVTTEDGKSKTYVLYKRDKGEIGQTLKDRPYVKSVSFGK
jgi:hypothetical protein